MSTGRPQVTDDGPLIPGERGRDAIAYVAVLPVFTGTEASGALVLTGDARDPFTALDDDFLQALGRQVGAALANADLHERLQARTVELARLSARMLEQHEEERRRLSRELHDETAQVFSAVKMELELLRGQVPDIAAPRLERMLGLVDKGIRGIRSVVNDLRPSLLDDLGLLPALRSLVADFSERSAIRITLEAPPGTAAALEGRGTRAVPGPAGGAVQRGASCEREGGVGADRRARAGRWCSWSPTTAADRTPPTRRCSSARDTWD